MKRFSYLIPILLILTFFSSVEAFSHYTSANSIRNQRATIDVDITINSQTTDAEFKEIVAFLKEHDIEATITQLKRNDSDEITSLKITLKDNQGSRLVNQQSSNIPIKALTFGRKNNKLYIENTSGEYQANTLFDKQNDSQESILENMFSQLDSLKQNFQFDFTKEDFMKFFNSSAIDSLKQQLLQFNDDMFIFDTTKDINASNDVAKYRFFDDPKKTTHIIINGKASSFEELNKLAKSNQLESVDVLKGKTATSLYGDKAKDGAIIAVTKEN